MRLSWTPGHDPFVVAGFVKAICLQVFDVAPAEAACDAAAEPAAPLGPVLHEYVAENALGFGELGVVKRIGSVDAEAQLPHRAGGDHLAVVKHAASTSTGLLTNADAGAGAWHTSRGRVSELPRRAAQGSVLDVVGDGTRQRVEEALRHRHGCTLEASPHEGRHTINYCKGLISGGLAVEARHRECRVLHEGGGE